jgi:poly(A) polymerase Pap1
MFEAYAMTSEGKGKVRNLALIDSADVEIIKLTFHGMFIDISIKQVILFANNILDWRPLHP